jgi:hypothetical protein
MAPRVSPGACSEHRLHVGPRRESGSAEQRKERTVKPQTPAVDTAPVPDLDWDYLRRVAYASCRHIPLGITGSAVSVLAKGALKRLQDDVYLRDWMGLAA